MSGGVLGTLLGRATAGSTSGGFTPYVQSPTQASDIYCQGGNFAKQRHLFLVRFNLNGTTATPGNPFATLTQAIAGLPQAQAITPLLSTALAQGVSSSSAPTFAIKAVDRPKVAPHAEEVNQYNKKRQVYTGIKYEPVRVTFYDDGAGAAHQMWQAYANWYFGDFGSNNLAQFRYDATLPWTVGSGGMADGGNYGFTALNGGNSASGPLANELQFYFQSIDILHFFNGVYETYSLINPRIIGYDPDELDYQNAEIATITMQFSYEAITYTNPVAGQMAPELLPGGALYGSVLPVTNSTAPSISPFSGNLLAAALNGTLGAGGLAGTLLGGAALNLAGAALYGSDATGNSLLSYGDYSFGVGNSSGATPSSATDLTALAAGNSPLAAALTGAGDVAAAPIAVPLAVGQAALAGSPAGVAGQLSGAVGNVGAFGSTLGQAGLAASLAAGTAVAPNAGSTGVSLDPGTYSMMNAQGNGTAQYGVNRDTTASGGNAAPGFSAPALGGNVATLAGTVGNSIVGTPVGQDQAAMDQINQLNQNLNDIRSQRPFGFSLNSDNVPVPGL